VFGLRRRPPDLTPIQAEIDQVAADITKLHNLAYHPGRDCLEDADGRCAEISRGSTR